MSRNKSDRLLVSFSGRVNPAKMAKVVNYLQLAEGPGNLKTKSQVIRLAIDHLADLVDGFEPDSNTEAFDFLDSLGYITPNDRNERERFKAYQLDSLNNLSSEEQVRVAKYISTLRANKSNQDQNSDGVDLLKELMDIDKKITEG